jgi:hypothetical protein
MSTLLPSSVIMAGATGSLDPSGDLNAGNVERCVDAQGGICVDRQCRAALKSWTGPCRPMASR